MVFHLTVKILAKDWSIGDRVCANATKVLGARRGTAEQARKVQMRGRVTAKEGKGPMATVNIDTLRSLTRETC